MTQILSSSFRGGRASTSNDAKQREDKSGDGNPVQSSRRGFLAQASAVAVRVSGLLTGLLPSRAVVATSAWPTASNRVWEMPQRKDLVARAFGLLAFAAVLPAEMASAEPAFPLKYSASQKFLVDQNEAPFLLNGDSPWYLIQKATKAQTLSYLDDRQDRGFNGILVMLIERGFHDGTTTNGHHPFGGTENLDNIVSKIDERYFEHVDWVINEANKRNIVVYLPPAYLGSGGGGDGWARQFAAAGVNQSKAWGRWVGARYRSFKNIVWVMGGDTNYANDSQRRAHEAVIEGLLETDDTHLMTAHCDRGNAGLDCFDRPWLTLNSTYGHCDTAPALSKADYERIDRAPFIWYEGGYESSGSGNSCMRAQPYWSVLSGSSGHLYGNHDLWPFESGWQGALDDPGGASLEHFAKLFASRNWSALQPDFAHNVLTAGYDDIGSGEYVGSAMTKDRQTFIAYLPRLRAVTVNLSKLSGSQVKVWWFNPRNGSSQMAGTKSTSTTAARFTPPSSGDWVLVIDDEAAGLPAPGTGTVTPPADDIPPSAPINLTVN